MPLAVGSLVLLIAVVFGAFGAHGLKPMLSSDALAQWKTAVEYQFYHGFALVLLAALAHRLPPSGSKWIFRCFVAGVILFCGSVYLLSIRDLVGIQGVTPLLGPMTPLGGLCFLVGWGILFINALRTTDLG